MAVTAVLSTAAFVLAGKEKRESGSTIIAPAEPWTAYAASRLGGVVADVYVHRGDRVTKGERLVRLEREELTKQQEAVRSLLKSAVSALQSADLEAGMPPSVHSLMIENHPEVRAAEQVYVNSLAAFQREVQRGDPKKAQVELNRAATARMKARRHVAELLDWIRARKQLTIVIDQLHVHQAELDQALTDLSVRAPSDGVVDLMGADVGARIAPGRPLAVISTAGEYFCEFPVNVEAASRLHVGLESNGVAGSEHIPIRWQVDSITTRPIPPALRDDRSVTDEVVVRARFSSDAQLEPGTPVRLELP